MLKHTLNILVALSAIQGATGALAVSDSGFFGCSAPYVQDCRLKKTALAGSEARFADGESYEADYQVTYSFACDNVQYPSNLDLSAGKSDSHSILYYNPAEPTLVVTGQGPIQVRDLRPDDSRNELFGSCDLTISETHAPSSTQVQTWLTKEANLAVKIDLDVPQVELIATISTYYDLYVADPQSSAGFLRNEIARLTAPGSSSSDRQEAQAIAQILDAVPRSNVLSPLVAVKAELQDLYAQASALKVHLTAANQQLSQAFSDALTHAKAALN